MVGFSRAGYSSVGRGDDDDEAGRGLPLPVTTPGSSWRSSSDAAPTYPPPPPSSLSARSSKDKGKARAVPLPSGHTVENNSTAAADAESTQPPAMGMYFSIRFTDGSPDLLDMYVSAHESVRDVKQRVSPSVIRLDLSRAVKANLTLHSAMTLCYRFIISNLCLRVMATRHHSLRALANEDDFG